jgi:hypothetical protein
LATQGDKTRFYIHTGSINLALKSVRVKLCGEMFLQWDWKPFLGKQELKLNENESKIYTAYCILFCGRLIWVTPPTLTTAYIA